MIDVVEILQHWHAGRPKSVVASSLGVDPKTVRKYVAPAEAAGLVPGGPPLGRAEWAELVRGWFPELVDARARSLTFPVIDAHRERIADDVGDEHGGDGASAAAGRARVWRCGLPSFRRYVWLASSPDESTEIEGDGAAPGGPDAGEEAQIDYGFLGVVGRPGHGPGPAGVGVRDGAWRARGTCSCARCSRMDSPVVGGRPCGGVRVLRRRAAPAGAGQPEDRGRPARPV